jgi:ATP-dependent helicase/nuclease subunit A
MPQTRPQLTDQQRTAIELRGTSAALSAGAGCGKTFVLTRRFLRELEPATGRELAGIVAITFTEKAAREMRDRIRAACNARLRECPADEVDHWLTVMRAIDTARVSTIHAFCAALLRTFAVEAGLDPQFSVLEGTTGRALRRRVVTDAVHNLLTAHDEDCMLFVQHFGLERTIDLLIALAGDRFHGRLHPLAELSPQSRINNWNERWKSEFVPLLLRRLQREPSACRTMELLDEHTPSNEEMARRCGILLAALPSLCDHPDPVALLAVCREATKIQGGGGKSVWRDAQVYEDVKNALTELRDKIDRTLKDMAISSDDVAAAAEFSVLAERMLHPVLEQFENRKHKLAVVDFDDLLLKTHDLLHDKPSVRERAAAGIGFLMVDEFQDTDPVQAEIVRSLCGERLFDGKLFLVGDAKQSIYRFRRADPRVFDALRDEIPETGRLPLTRNFRSQPAILNFVNCLFAKAMGDKYEPLVPNVKQISPTPCIEFLFATPDAKEGNAPKESAEDRRRREADWIARRLRQLLDDPTPRIRTMESELRPVKPGDVAILFRTLSNVALYEESLREYGIDYYLVGGRAFFAQQEVFDVMNLCGWLDDPDDQVALAGVLRSPMFGLTDESLFLMCAARESLGNALNHAAEIKVAPPQRGPLRFAAEVLEELRANKDRLPLAELLELFLDRTGYDAVLLTEFLGRRKLANLRKLVDMAREFDREGLLTLSEFIQRLRDSVLEEADEELAATSPESGNVVQLMTVHKSKGLEFPVTVVADMNWTRGGGSAAPRFHPTLGPLFSLPAEQGESRRNRGQTMHKLEEETEDERETVRLLYVATTRAADHLILSAGLPEPGRVSSPWLRLVGERFDLRTGLPAVDPYLGRISLGDVPPENIPDILVHHMPPVVGKPASDSDRRLRLSDLRDAVESADPAPVPPLLPPIPPRVGRLLEISVTDILNADRELHPGGSKPEAQAKEFASHPSLALQASMDATESPDARTLGTLIHRVAERWDPATATDLEAFVRIVADGMDDPGDDAMRGIAVRRVKALFDSSHYAEIVQAMHCLREVDFRLRRVVPIPDGEPLEVHITGRIDCLYQSADGTWHLIDFKTGHIDNADPESLVDDYAVQLQVYASATELLIGRPPNDVALIHVEDTIRRLPMTGKAFAPDVIDHRIEAAIALLRRGPSIQQSQVARA